MKALNLNDIENISDAVLQEVDMSAWWGGSVYITSLTLEDHLNYAQRTEQNKKLTEVEMMVEWIIAATVNENGSKMFIAPKSREILKKKNMHALKHLFRQIIALNTVSQEDVEKKPEA